MSRWRDFPGLIALRVVAAEHPAEHGHRQSRSSRGDPTTSGHLRDSGRSPRPESSEECTDRTGAVSHRAGSDTRGSSRRVDRPRDPRPPRVFVASVSSSSASRACDSMSTSPAVDASRELGRPCSSTSSLGCVASAAQALPQRSAASLARPLKGKRTVRARAPSWRRRSLLAPAKLDRQRSPPVRPSPPPQAFRRSSAGSSMRKVRRRLRSNGPGSTSNTFVGARAPDAFTSSFTRRSSGASSGAPSGEADDHVTAHSPRLAHPALEGHLTDIVVRRRARVGFRSVPGRARQASRGARHAWSSKSHVERPGSVALMEDHRDRVLAGGQIERHHVIVVTLGGAPPLAAKTRVPSDVQLDAVVDPEPQRNSGQPSPRRPGGRPAAVAYTFALLGGEPVDLCAAFLTSSGPPLLLSSVQRAFRRHAAP